MSNIPVSLNAYHDVRPTCSCNNCREPKSFPYPNPRKNLRANGGAPPIVPEEFAWIQPDISALTDQKKRTMMEMAQSIMTRLHANTTAIYTTTATYPSSVIAPVVASLSANATARNLQRLVTSCDADATEQMLGDMVAADVMAHAQLALTAAVERNTHDNDDETAYKQVVHEIVLITRSAAASKRIDGLVEQSLVLLSPDFLSHIIKQTDDTFWCKYDNTLIKVMFLADDPPSQTDDDASEGRFIKGISADALYVWADRLCNTRLGNEIIVPMMEVQGVRVVWVQPDSVRNTPADQQLIEAFDTSLVY